MIKNLKEALVRIESLEQEVGQYKAALFAKSQEIRALQQKLGELINDGNTNNGP